MTAYKPKYLAENKRRFELQRELVQCQTTKNRALHALRTIAGDSAYGKPLEDPAAYAAEFLTQNKLWSPQPTLEL